MMGVVRWIRTEWWVLYDEFIKDGGCELMNESYHLEKVVSRAFSSSMQSAR